MGTMLIADRYLPNMLSDSVRWVLLRSTRKQDSIKLAGLRRSNFLILDGSNAMGNIWHIEEKAKHLGLPYYVLKDNFAYVWEKPD